VRQHVDARIRPWQQPAVEPNRVGWSESHTPQYIWAAGRCDTKRSRACTPLGARAIFVRF